MEVFMPVFVRSRPNAFSISGICRILFLLPSFCQTCFNEIWMLRWNLRQEILHLTTASLVLYTWRTPELAWSAHLQTHRWAGSSSDGDYGTEMRGAIGGFTNENCLRTTTIVLCIGTIAARRKSIKSIDNCQLIDIVWLFWSMYIEYYMVLIPTLKINRENRAIMPIEM